MKKDTMYAAMLTPFSDYVARKKKKEVPAYELVVQGSLKKSNQSLKLIHSVLTHYPLIRALVNSPEFPRVEIGRALKKAGEYRTPNLLVALASDIRESGEKEEVKGRYREWVRRVQEGRLWEAHSMKPLLNGNEICEVLDIPKGPALRKISEAILEWMYEHGEEYEGTEAGRERVVQFLRATKSSYL